MAELRTILSSERLAVDAAQAVDTENAGDTSNFQDQVCESWRAVVRAGAGVDACAGV